MPFPSNNQNGVQAANQLISHAKNLKNTAKIFMDQCDAQSLKSHDLIATVTSVFFPARNTWNQLKEVEGVVTALRTIFPSAWANDQETITALNDVLAKLDAAIAYIVTNTPVDANGWVTTLKVVNNIFDQRVISNAQACANLKTQLNTLYTAIG